MSIRLIIEETNQNQALRFPSNTLAIANFLASFGGGVILGKMMGLLSNVPYLKGDSLLAYLFGSTLGIVVLKISGKNKTIKNVFFILDSLKFLLFLKFLNFFCFQLQHE